MKRLIDFMGLTVGSYLGWWVGALVSLYTGIMVSFVGMGVGLYAARRFTKNYLP